MHRKKSTGAAGEGDYSEGSKYLSTQKDAQQKAVGSQPTESISRTALQSPKRMSIGDQLQTKQPHLRSERFKITVQDPPFPTLGSRTSGLLMGKGAQPVLSKDQL